MKTVTLKLYSFKELNEEAKEVAKENYYNNEMYEWLEEAIECELEAYDVLGLFSNIDLKYSFSYCQGDGISFSADVNKEKLLLPYKTTEMIKENICVEVKKNTGHYSFASANDVDVWVDNIKSTKIVDKIKSDLQAYYLDICNKLEQYGYRQIEYRADNTEFAELVEDVDYLESGEVYL